MVQYKYLTERGEHYAGEEGTSGERLLALRALESRLKQAIVDLRNAETVPKVATGKSVKDLIQFHEAQQFEHRKAQAEEARRKVERYTRWLNLEGAVVDKEGNINWNKSTRKVVYDSDLARQAMTRIHFQNGRLFVDSAFRKPLDTKNMVTHFSGPGRAIYVMSATGNLHVGSHSVGHRHHSSLLAGANVACGGELEVNRGRLVWLSNKSGHYRPDVPHLLQILHQLQKKQVSMTFRLTVFSASGRREYTTVGAFLKDLELDDEPDYELMKLMAYSQHLTDAALAQNGWRWRRDESEAPGVYQIATNQPVAHKRVRQWLKSTGRFANVSVQSGQNR